jgi:transposase-like zinc-binding protein
MTRPLFEVADVIRTAGRRFRERASLTWPQAKVLNAIARCRTVALGGHRDQCSNCGYQAYNSCRNRHCPKCQTNARDQWLRKRQQQLLPVGYYPLVFSVPHALVPLMWQNKRRLFALLFEGQRGPAAGSHSRSQASRRADRPALHPAHLGTDPPTTPHIHCVVPRRRPITGSHSLDIGEAFSARPPHLRKRRK